MPELSGGAAWPFEVIGVAFGLVGVFIIAYAYDRQKLVEDALARGDYAPFGRRAGLFFAALGMLLGLGTIVIILVQSSYGRRTESRCGRSRCRPLRPAGRQAGSAGSSSERRGGTRP